MNAQIAKELITLAAYDLAVRERLLKENKLTQGYNLEMEAVHKANASRLSEIIDVIGWPTISKVGDEASEAAWLIVQHSIGEPGFVRRCYALMNESAADINPQNLAYLYDRICYFEGKPQKYGTQYDEGGMYPVENKNEVNDLRRKIKLKPHLEDTIVEVKSSNDSDDIHNDAGFNEWRKKTGWI